MADKYKGKNKEEILVQIEKRAYELHDRYHGCGQAGLLAIMEAFDLKNETVFKSASGLSAGIGRMRSACGALLGGTLALGLKYGREISDLDKSPQEAMTKELASFEPVGRLYKWFEHEFGSALCRDIRKSFIGVDLDFRIPWEKEMGEKLGLHKRCCEISRKTARRVAELMMADE